MTELMHSLIGLSVGSSIVLKATAILALGWILHGLLLRANPRWRVLLWRGVLVGLALLPLYAGVVTLPVAIAPPPPLPVTPSPVFAAMVPASLMEPAQLSFSRIEKSFSPSPLQPARPAFSMIDWGREHGLALAVALWALGVIFLSLRLMIIYFRVPKILSAACPAPPRLQALLDRITADLGYTRPVALRLARDMASPILSGLRRPAIYLPARLIQPEDINELTAILAHEVAHLRARDLYWLLAARWASLLLWPHPLAWRLQNSHAEACEEVSDAVAAHYLKDATAYVRTLARVALAIAGHPSVLAGIPMARSSQITGRLNILKRKIYASPLARRWVLLALFLGSTLMLGIGSVRLVHAQTAPESGQAKVADIITPPSPPLPGARVVQFPKDRSLGLLSMHDAGLKREIETFYHWINGADTWGNGESLGEAQGDVIVPAGKRLQLTINAAAASDLTPLAWLSPNDLDTLNLNYQLTDAGLACLAGLKGLRVLNLIDYGMQRGPDAPALYSSIGLKALEGLNKLEYLSAPSQIDDWGLGHIARIKSLKGLYFKTNRLTNAGLAQLAALPLLEELELGGNEVGDAGLEHLTKLPRLRYLLLWGDNFSDAGMAWLPGIPALTNLNISHLTISDAGLASIGKIAGLERLDLYRTYITDAGLAHLAGLKSLKKLDLSLTNISGAGMQSLKSIKSLDHLDLPDNIINDQSLAALAELTNLKHLRLPNTFAARRADDKVYYTDKGLALLCSRVPGLEELFIGGVGIGDEGMTHVGQLPRLRDLTVFGSPKVTNQGLARLAAATSLEKLDFADLSISTAGVNHLNALLRLRELNITLGGNDAHFCDATLDLSGLTRLEKIISFPPIRDEDLACLANLTRLQWLQVSSAEGRGRISDVGAAQLARLTNLDRLALCGPNLTDQGLSALAGMTKMDCLTLRGNFTDEGLRRLGGLKALRQLNMFSVETFTPAAVEYLRKSLPMIANFNVQGGQALMH